MDSGVTTYQTVETLGKSQVELILKVYDGALGAFTAAREAFTAEEYETGRNHLERARRFLVHLYTTLDQENGEEIGRSLGRLYTYLICQIDAARATRDPEIVAGNIRILENLRTGWAGLRDQEHSERSQPQTEPVGAEGSFEISG